MRVRRAVVPRALGPRFGSVPAAGRRPRFPSTRPPLRRVAQPGGGVTRTRPGLEILAAGAAGGVIGDALLRAMPWGLNVALGTAGLVTAGVWLVRRHRVTPGPDAAWLAITAVLLGAAFVRRDAAALARFDMLALVGALAFAAASLQGERIMRWTVIDYVPAGISATVARIAGGPL